MNRSSFPQIVSILVMLFIAAVAFADPQAAYAQPQPQDGDNLLVNGGFEWPYNDDFTAKGGGQVAHGWNAWWYDDPGNTYDTPEFKPASIEVDPHRVRDGVVAQQYFKDSALHMAGLYQRVPVPVGSHVRFTVYGHAWATFCVQGNNKLDCDARDSSHGGVDPITMKVGIDPTGGTDAFSQAIVWSAGRAVYDNYEQFVIEADAQGDAITVFVYSTPEWAAPVVNVFWDNAVLTASGGGGQPAPPAANSGSANNAPPQSGSSGNNIQPQPRREDGSQWHTVASGETLGRIAIAYETTVQSIRELNSLSSDTISVGEELLIEAATVTATPTDQPAEEPTPTPGEVAESESSSGEICLNLFDDANENGLSDPEEGTLGGGLLSLSGGRSESMETSSVEVTCFSDLPGGDYEILAVPPDGYHLTGLSRIPVTLSDAGSVSLGIGAAAGGIEPEAPTGTPAGIPRNILVLGGIGLLLLLGIGAGGTLVFLLYSRDRGKP